MKNIIALIMTALCFCQLIGCSKVSKVPESTSVNSTEEVAQKPQVKINTSYGYWVCYDDHDTIHCELYCDGIIRHESEIAKDGELKDLKILLNEVDETILVVQDSSIYQVGDDKNRKIFESVHNINIGGFYSGRSGTKPNLAIFAVDENGNGLMYEVTTGVSHTYEPDATIEISAYYGYLFEDSLGVWRLKDSNSEAGTVIPQDIAEHILHEATSTEEKIDRLYMDIRAVSPNVDYIMLRRAVKSRREWHQESRYFE